VQPVPPAATVEWLLSVRSRNTLTEVHGNGRGIQVSMLFVRADHLFQSRPDRA
jgi:hypothetical protein